MAADNSANTGGEIPTAFNPPPDDLKTLSPFLQRAHETRKADPALSYWCNYHAAQLGISKLSTLSSSSKAFLMTLMDSLEAQKKSLAGNDIVHGDDLVAKAHIENVALKVFAGADNEDRNGKASKATARRFLVAGNFIDVLTNFGPLDSEWEGKLKYAKWKAADIARAFREGRKPTPGPAGGLEEDMNGNDVTEGATQEEGDDVLRGIQSASARMGGMTDVTAPLPTTEELDAEMAKLTSQEETQTESGPIAISPNIEPPTPDRTGHGVANFPEDMSPSQIRSRRAQSRLSFDSRAGQENWQDMMNSSDPSTSASSPNFSMPLRLTRQGSQTSDDPNSIGIQQPSETQSAYFQYQQGRVPSGSGASSPHHRPLPQPPGSNSGRGNLPIPPGGQGLSSPLIPSASLSPAVSPSMQHSPAFPPSNHFQPSAPPTLANASITPSAPSVPVPAVEATNTTFPTTLDHSATSRVQKLAKWAVSALDYDDVETARKQLREALDICEGRAIGK